MPKPKSKSNKDSSQAETPSSPEQQLLSIKPKRPQQDTLAGEEKTIAQPVEQKLLGIKPKKTEEVASPSQTQSQSTSVPEPTQTSQKLPELVTEKPVTDKEVTPPQVPSSPQSKEVTQTPRRLESPAGAENQENKPQKPAFQKPQLKKPQPPPYKNLEEVTISSGETFTVGEQVKVTTANYGEYVVAIKFIYEAADGSIWASYSHTNKEQRHPWRWGCCRADLLKKELNE